MRPEAPGRSPTMDAPADAHRLPPWIDRPYFWSLLLLVATFVASPWVEAIVPRGLSVGLTLYFLLLSASLWLGLLASHPGRRLFRLGTVLAAAIPLSSLVTLGRGDVGLTTVPARLMTSVLVALACFVMFRVLIRAQRIDVDRIFCAILVYLLIGVLWSVLYGALDRVLGGGIRGMGTDLPEGEHLYFSFVTLSTLGFGDIVPVHPAMRVLVVLEAVAGQLYLTILVARLVAIHVMDSRPAE